MAFVDAGIGIENDDTTVEISVGDKQLVCFRIDEQSRRPTEICRVVAAAIFSSMADLQKQLPFGRELQDLVIFPGIAAEPDIVFVIDENPMLGGKPLVTLSWPSPRLKELSVRVEFQHSGRRSAALGLRRIQGSGLLSVRNGSGTMEDPDIVV